MVENAKIEKFKCDILSNFETMCWMFYQEKMSKYVWEIKTPFILVNFGFFFVELVRTPGIWQKV